MFDKYWFYLDKQISESLYDLDVWASINLILKNSEYIVFHKRKFKKIPLNQMQNGMHILTKSQDLDFKLSEKFFVYAMTYYQRNWNKAYLKWFSMDEKDVYQDLFKNFWLELKFIEYLEIYWNYSDIETIAYDIKNASLDEAFSFLLGLASVFWEWNLVEEDADVFLWNILIKLPFDGTIWEYHDIIINLEDILIKNWFYNQVTFSKKQNFIINIKDFDILRIFWKKIKEWKLEEFFQTQEVVKPYFSKTLKKFSDQLDTDLRIKLDKFKLIEVKKVSLSF